jgi:hypothetical protein
MIKHDGLSGGESADGLRGCFRLQLPHRQIALSLAETTGLSDSTCLAKRRPTSLRLLWLLWLGPSTLTLRTPRLSSRHFLYCFFMPLSLRAVVEGYALTVDINFSSKLWSDE